MNFRVGEHVIYGHTLCQIVGISEEGCVYLWTSEYKCVLRALSKELKSLIRPLTKLERALK